MKNKRISSFSISFISSFRSISRCYSRQPGNVTSSACWKFIHYLWAVATSYDITKDFVNHGLQHCTLQFEDHSFCSHRLIEQLSLCVLFFLKYWGIYIRYIDSHAPQYFRFIRWKLMSNLYQMHEINALPSFYMFLPGNYWGFFGQIYCLKSQLKLEDEFHFGSYRVFFNIVCFAFTACINT